MTDIFISITITTCWNIKHISTKKKKKNEDFSYCLRINARSHTLTIAIRERDNQTKLNTLRQLVPSVSRSLMMPRCAKKHKGACSARFTLSFFSFSIFSTRLFRSQFSSRNNRKINECFIFLAFLKLAQTSFEGLISCWWEKNQFRFSLSLSCSLHVSPITREI